MFTHNQKYAVIALAILIVVWNASFASSGDAITLELSAGDYDRECTVVAVELPESMQDTRHFTLTRLDTGKTVPVQVDCIAGKPCVVWIIGDKLESGKTRKYRLAPATDKPSEKGGVTIEDDGKHLLVKVGERPVLTYNHAVVPSPDPKQPYYARSGYIHPLFNPAGQVVTDDFAPDHMHQHGIMFPWTNTTFEGRPVDFWNQRLRQGKVEHVRFEAMGGGPVVGFFNARLRHVDLTAPAEPKTALDETWDVRVYNFSDHFLFDITSTQTCACDSPLVIKQYYYGGMAIRGHRAWLQLDKSDFLTSQGNTRKNGNHTRPRWCDIHGPVEERTTGVAVMAHPGNFRFPQVVRLHPKHPYFCFAPMVLGPFTIEPGKPYVSRYRYYVHDGKLDPNVADRLWQDFAHPPEVFIVAEQ